MERKRKNELEEWTRIILGNFLCLNCGKNYESQDNKETCPHCKMTRKEQIENYKKGQK